MNSVTSFLGEILFTSGIIWSVTMILKKLLRKELSPKAHLALWLVLIIRLMLPVTFDIGVHFITIPAAETALSASSSSPVMQPIRVTEGRRATAATGGPAAGTAPSASSRETLREAAYHTADAPAMDPAAVTLSIWLIGIGTGTFLSLRGYIRLRRRIREREVPDCSLLHVLFRECLRRSGIRKDIVLTVQETSSGPALIYPNIVVVPQSMLEMEQEEVRLAFRHELMHFQRKDHVLSFTLCILRIVWWFNPFIWLAMKAIRQDIETACDSDVVRSLGKDGKKAYANLLVSMFRYTGFSPAVLGMAFSGARRNAEKRIKGVFMKRRSSALGRTAVLCFAAIIGVACFTTACQPTPEKPAVVDRRESVPESALTGGREDADPAATAAPAAQYAVQEHWKESTEKTDGFRIVADADVLVPDVDAYPVEQLAPRQITQEMADQMIAYFAPDAVFYRTAQAATKPYLEARILEEREALADAERSGDVQAADAARDMIALFSGMYEDAPDSAEERQEATTEFGPMNYTGSDSSEKNYIGISADAADGSVQEFLVLRGSREAPWESREFRYTNTYFVLESDDAASEEFWEKTAADLAASGDADISGMDQQIRDLMDELSRRKPLFAQNTMNQEKAVKEISTLLECFGIRQMQMNFCDRALLTPSYSGSPEDVPEDFLDGTYSGTSEEGLYLEFVRDNGGMPCLQPDVQFWEPAQGGEVYAAPFSPETVSVVLDAAYNIRFFRWNSPTEVVDIISQNSTLLPLDEIKERLTEEVYRSYLAEEARVGEISMAACELTEMKLVMGYVNAKDAPDDALAVPAWLIRTITRMTVDGDETEIAEDIMMNALDGTRILIASSF